MSTKIRLTRGGRKKVPYYTVVVADSRRPRDGKFIEKIGTYNPLLKSDDENRFKIDKERAEYWISVGSQPTERVAILMIKAGIKAAEKFKPVFIPKKKKIVEKEVKAEEVPTTEVKVEAPKAEEKPVEETPKAETPKEEVEAPKAEEVPVEEVKVEAPKAEEKPVEETSKTESPKEEKSE